MILVYYAINKGTVIFRCFCFKLLVTDFHYKNVFLFLASSNVALDKFTSIK